MSTSKVPMRLRGILRFGERGAVLEVEEGPVWRIETSDDLSVHAGALVQMEAYQQGANRLELLWIGRVTD